MHEFPIGTTSTDTQQNRLQAEMKAVAKATSRDPEPVCHETLYKYIIDHSTTAVVEHITPEGLELLRQYAPVCTDINQIIKRNSYYWDNCGDAGYGSAAWHTARQQQRDHVTWRSLNLQERTYRLDADELLDAAAGVSAGKLAELISHWREYCTLAAKLTDNGISREDSEQMMQRLDEILNGRQAEEVIDLDWRLKQALYNPDRWDITVIESLYVLLGGSSQPHTRSAELGLYISNIQVADLVSQGLQELESRKTDRSLGNSSLSYPLWQE